MIVIWVIIPSVVIPLTSIPPARIRQTRVWLLVVIITSRAGTRSLIIPTGRPIAVQEVVHLYLHLHLLPEDHSRSTGQLPLPPAQRISYFLQQALVAKGSFIGTRCKHSVSVAQ